LTKLTCYSRKKTVLQFPPKSYFSTSLTATTSLIVIRSSFSGNWPTSVPDFQLSKLKEIIYCPVYLGFLVFPDRILPKALTQGFLGYCFFMLVVFEFS